jgi:hypothetical protein
MLDPLFSLHPLITSFDSIAASNGRNSAHFVNGCLPSTPVHNYFDPELIHPTKSETAARNTSNACRLRQSRIEPWQFSRNLMSPARSEHTMSIGTLSKPRHVFSLLMCTQRDQHLQYIATIQQDGCTTATIPGHLDGEDVLLDRRTLPHSSTSL